MITEAEIVQLWKDRAKSELDENTNFLRSVRGKEINKKAADLNDEAFSKVDCLQCANCCKTTPAMVTRSDVKRIAKSLQMAPKIFIRKYLIEDIDGSLMFNGVPCRFLNDDHTCAIYDVRPEACRGYPHLDDFKFASRPRLNAQNTLICPAAYYVVLRLRNEQQ